MPTAKELNLNVGDIVRIAMPGNILDEQLRVRHFYTDRKRGARAEVVETDVDWHHGTRLRFLDDQMCEYRVRSPRQVKGSSRWQTFLLATDLINPDYTGRKGDEVVIGPANHSLTLYERKSL